MRLNVRTHKCKGECEENVFTFQVFTSTLTPLVGVGIVSLERMYPMTLGSNIGTTVTGILAAMSVKGKHSGEAMQIALCHMFFNVTAVLIFYPIPFMRIPIPMA